MKPLSVVYISNAQGGGDSPRWKQLLGEVLGRPIEMSVWPDRSKADAVELVLAWKAPRGAIAAFPNQKMIVSLGMGVDHLLTDDSLPAGVPITRIMDAGLIGQMSEYAIYHALRHHRAMPNYEASQRARKWTVEPFVDTIDRRIGVMGLGAIGTDIVRKFVVLGFPTLGWSRTARSIEGVECHHGTAGLDAFLARTDILVNVVPLTRETTGIINARLLGKLPKDAYLINIGRGGHVVDADLLAALDSGHLSGAALDVFNEEPLPPASVYWTHPKVMVTPHIAGETNPRTAAIGVAENVRRLEAGQTLLHTVDRATGY